MSWATCNSGSNNIHFGFPPIMSDGRNYAQWLPGSEINKKIKDQNGITTNSDYRAYLQKNADEIISHNQLASCNECCSCPIRYKPSNTDTKTPYLYKSCTDSTQPYGYDKCDLRENYLSKQELNTRLLDAPVLTQEQYLNRKIPNYN